MSQIDMTSYKLTIIPEDELTDELYQQGFNNLIDVFEDIDTIEGWGVLIIEPALDLSKSKEITRGLDTLVISEFTNDEVIDFVNDIIIGSKNYPKTESSNWDCHNCDIH